MEHGLFSNIRNIIPNGMFFPATAQIRKTEGKYGSWILNYGNLIDIPGATILCLQNPDDQGDIFVCCK